MTNDGEERERERKVAGYLVRKAIFFSKARSGIGNRFIFTDVGGALSASCLLERVLGSRGLGENGRGCRG